MTERPLPRPDHEASRLSSAWSSPLRGSGRRDWLVRHAAGVAALALGALAFIVVAVSQDRVWETPDWRISVPGFAATSIAAIVSLVRRERAYPYWLFGLGLAAAALVLGWFMMLVIVIGATCALVVILHAVM